VLFNCSWNPLKTYISIFHLKKIDKMTGAFLDSTKETRASTKMAAAASKAMEGTGKGLEMGSWGTLSGRTVIAAGTGSLLGSIDNAAQKEQKQAAGTGETTTGISGTPTTAKVENRIIFVADTKQVWTRVWTRFLS
jgi:hypothetical protein